MVTFFSGARHNFKMGVMSRAIVPYVRRRTPFTLGPRARMAISLGKYAWANRKRIKRTYNRIVRKRGNKITRNARKEIGERIGTTSANHTVPQNSANELESRTLYETPLIEIPEGTGQTARLRDTVNLRGFSFWFNLTNLIDETAYFNYAVIVPKHNDVISQTNFFRGYGAQRAVAFNGAALSTLDFRFRPINTDQYHILTHRRLTLGPRATDKDSNIHTKIWRHYVRLHKQIRFDVNGDEIPVTQVYIVWWIDYSNGAAGSSNVPNCASLITHYTTYHRNTKH